MRTRQINRNVNSIKRGLIGIGFVSEAHNTHSFFKHFDIGFRDKKGYDVYITYDLTGWTIKVVDLEDKNDHRNSINGTLSFNNHKNKEKFFDLLFGQILFKLYVKVRSDAIKDCSETLNQVMGQLKLIL